MEEFRILVEQSYRIKQADILEQALKLKFPKMKGLNIDFADGKFSITLDDDGSYTKEEVEKFLIEFRTGNGKKIELNDKTWYDAEEEKAYREFMRSLYKR